MATYLVSYNLNSPGQDYTSVLERIKSYPNWARLGGSTYAVTTQASAGQVFEHVAAVMDNNDQLYVIALHAPWQAGGKDTNKVVEWLKNNLTPC